MAYLARSADQKQKYLIQRHYAGGPFNDTEWVYYTLDTIATVDGSNYFADVEAVAVLKVGHRVWVYQLADLANINAGIVDVAVLVVVENTGTVVDLSVRLVSAAVTYGD